MSTSRFISNNSQLLSTQSKSLLPHRFSSSTVQRDQSLHQLENQRMKTRTLDRIFSDSNSAWLLSSDSSTGGGAVAVTLDSFPESLSLSGPLSPSPPPPPLLNRVNLSNLLHETRTPLPHRRHEPLGLAGSRDRAPTPPAPPRGARTTGDERSLMLSAPKLQLARVPIDRDGETSPP